MDVESFLFDVCTHADDNRESFGFLPEQSYLERAQENRLWVLTTDDNEYVGHLIYGGKHPTLKIFQIYIAEGYRGLGHSNRLITEIKEFAESNSYSLLSARVASDLPANKFWRSAGFKIVRQEQGGKTTGRFINQYAFELDGNSLLNNSIEDITRSGQGYEESPILRKPVYVLDLNLVFDLVRGTAATKETSALVAAAFDGNIKLCVTPELPVELERKSYDIHDDPMLAFAKNLPSLREVEQTQLDSINDDLRKIIFPNRSLIGKGAPNDKSDLNHIAICILHNVDGFVTREKALIRTSLKIKKQYGLEVLSPFDFFVDSRESASLYERGDYRLGTSEISIKPYALNIRADVENFLRSLGVVEGEISRVIELNIKNNDSQKLVVTSNPAGNVVGFLSWDVPRKLRPISECFLYVDESYGEAITTVDHLIETVFRSADRDFPCRIDLFTSYSQIETRCTAKKRGFKEQADRRKLSKVFCKGVIDEKGWEVFSLGYSQLTGVPLRRSLPTYNELINTGMPTGDSITSFFDYETIISPGVLLPKGRDGLMLPIKAKFAKQLLGVDSQADMFAAKEALLSVEKLYVRSKQRSSYFDKGCIVVFYVSKEKRMWGEAIGFARITYSEVINTTDVAIKLSRQGVLTEEDLEEISDDKGMVHAVTFDNFNVFDTPIPFSELKESGVVSGANLVTVEKVSWQQISRIFCSGFD